MHSTALLYPSPYSPIPLVLIQPHSDRKSVRCVQSVIFLQCGIYLAGTHSFSCENTIRVQCLLEFFEYQGTYYDLSHSVWCFALFVLR